jgi:hypothetical protein
MHGFMFWKYNVCYNINWYAYFNFGNKWYNRTYNYGDSISGSTTLGNASGLAVLGEYCNKKPDPNNCCCLKKGAHWNTDTMYLGRNSDRITLCSDENELAVNGQQ